MFKQSIIVILLILTAIIALSGCTTKTASNGTFGEKVISIDSILISNNTTADNYKEDNGTEYYYIDGYLLNNNSNDAFHVKVNTTVYDANGNVVATNDTAYLNPITIPSKGFSEFYVEFNDTNEKIVRYDIKVTDAKASL